MGVFVKICGLASGADVKAVAALHPDALGFVFWPGSPRCVKPGDVALWTAGLPAGVRKVGVFVDEKPEQIMESAQTAGLDILQLHGSESAAACAACGMPLWKVVHVDKVSMAEMSGYRVDAFVVDSYTASSPGGTGTTCDWGAARRVVEGQATPVILAGGLTPWNVAEAVRQVSPWGVDVSSGVEQCPGVKDLGRVKDFIATCRRL